MSNLIIGTDECGCSAQAGQVLAAAVIINEGQKKIAGVNDSKELTKQRRESLIDNIKNNVLCFGIGSASVEEIKTLNIYWAKLLAIKRACEQIIDKGFIPNKIIVDGNKTIPDFEYEQEAIIKADKKVWFVGAASIIGKVTRDNLMADLAKKKEYSYYGWTDNAGYFNKNHMKGIIKYGFSDLHRKEFVYSQFCISLHKEFMKSGLIDVDEWLEKEYGDKLDLKNDWTLYRYWKQNREIKLKTIGWY